MILGSNQSALGSLGSQLGAGSISGVAVAYVLTAECGTFVETGSPISFQTTHGEIHVPVQSQRLPHQLRSRPRRLKHYRVMLACGRFRLTGRSIQLLAARHLIAEAAAVAVTGAQAGLRRLAGLVLASASFVRQGASSRLLVARTASLQPGQLATRGLPAQFRYDDLGPMPVLSVTVPEDPIDTAWQTLQRQQADEDELVLLGVFDR